MNKTQPTITKIPMANFESCACNFCGAEVRFEVSKAGELVNCENCGMETVIFTSGSELPYPAEQFVLKAVNIRWFKNPLSFRNIIGEVQNTSNKDLDWVRIEFALVNREAVPVGIASDCRIGLQANEIWRFSAPVFQADAVGVGAPLISCEFGRLCAPRGLIFASRPDQSLVPPPSASAKPVKLSLEDTAPPQADSQWSGLRITGGVTGTAHRQTAGSPP